MNQSRQVAPAPLWVNVVAGVTRLMPAGRDRLIHLLCHGRDKIFLGRMPRALGGFQFLCSLRDMIARDVFFAGCYEPQETLFLQTVLRPNMSFVDVGANWGFFTLMAAHMVGALGKVIAIEADPRMALKLKSNVKYNNLKHVAIFDVAIADTDASLMMAGYEETGENCGISRLVDRASQAVTKFEVAARRLDPLLDEAGLETVDVLKIDVEGAEDLVLSGMEAGLNSHRYRCILLELHPQQLAERGRTIEEITNYLIGKGYQGCVLDYSHAARRKARYNSRLHLSELIRPLEQLKNDPWPHTIWTSPGVNLNVR